MDKVSIIIPVYNVEKYLKKCLDSVINQTYKNLDIIIINDGSTDGSERICQEYANIDSRIRLINQQNHGAGFAKNIGLNNVKGEYFTFLDSDDYVDRNWIETMINISIEFNCEIVECSFIKEYLNNSEYIVHEKNLLNVEEYMKRYVNEWTCSLFWNKLFKTNLIGKIRFKNERKCIDDEFFTYKICSKAKNIYLIDDTLYHYRQRRSSAVFNNKHKYQITNDALDVLIERYQWIKMYFPNISNIYFNHDINILYYFVSNLPFDSDSKKIFLKTYWFYLTMCIKHYLNKKNMKLLVLLFIRYLKIRENENLKNVEVMELFE